ncbi:hypothetical protein, partial [Amycolatopsis thermalba]|uniref:hypothetical protein n=1 Tax=Amycolatopsis thermalba TaxID=944492 RepID=UPI00196884FF
FRRCTQFRNVCASSTDKANSGSFGFGMPHPTAELELTTQDTRTPHAARTAAGSQPSPREDSADVVNWHS